MNPTHALPDSDFTRGERLAGGLIATLLWLLSAGLLVALTIWSMQPAPSF